MSNTVAHDAFNHFVADLRATHGDNLASVVLYGPAAAGDAGVPASDINILVALERITPEDLRLSQAPVREWRRMGHPLPVYFTFAELREAADVFPIEFHQMERARVVLHGRDPFESLQFSDVNLRHQTEYELRSKLLQLRRLYVPASASVERLTNLMRESLTTFASLFAPALTLSGVEPPVRQRDCVEAAARAFGLEREPFARIFDLREGARAATMSDVEANELFARYLVQIERVIEAVDRLNVSGIG